MLGSVLYLGDVFGSTFDFGDVFGSAIDVNKPPVCLHIHYGDVFEGVVYFGCVFGSKFSFGDVLGSTFVIGDVYGLLTKTACCNFVMFIKQIIVHKGLTVMHRPQR
jgi:hypothetical protein